MNKKTDQPVILSPTEKKILDHLIFWKGEVVPYHEFWALDVELGSLHVYMAHIRRTGAQIGNVRNKGYIYSGGYMEPKQEKPNPADYRPTSGPRCKVCDKVLMPYDRNRGECISHFIARNRTYHDEKVHLTVEYTRNHVLENYRSKKTAEAQ